MAGFEEHLSDFTTYQTSNKTQEINNEMQYFSPNYLYLNSYKNKSNLVLLYSTSRKVAGSNPDEVDFFFN
jgi:hypothetical protein